MRWRIRVGMAIAIDAVAASWCVRGEATEWIAPLETDGRSAPSAEVLRAAFTDLRSHLPAVARISLAIAILPPLARVRRIELPRMSDQDRRSAIARASERHFAGMGESVVCAVERRAGKGAVVPFFAAAAPFEFISHLEQAAHEFDWVVDRFVPAQVAWLTAGLRRWSDLRRGDARLVVADMRETTVLLTHDGSLSIARRLRAGDALPSGNPSRSKSFILADDNRSAALVAAGAARVTRSLQLIPDAVRRARADAQVRVTRWLLCATAACILAAAGVYRLGLSRQLNAIAIQRSALHSRVSKAVAARDTLDQLLRMLRAMQALEHSAPAWSSRIARIALALPQNTSLTTLRADGDSISLDGQAGDAASVFAALRSTPGMLDVRSTAPIRQDLTIGTSAMEHWTIAFRVGRDTSARGSK